MAGIGVAGYAAITGAVAALATTGVAISNSAEARHQAADQATALKDNQNKTLEAQKKSEADAQNNTLRDQQQKAIRGSISGNAGRAGTILTSPLGLSGADTPRANKTILGA